MAETIDKDELDEFMESVDRTIDMLEKGKSVDLDEIAGAPKEVADIVVESSATTIGENEMVEKEKVVRKNSERVIIGAVKANMVVITDKNDVETVYGNAAAAADKEGVNPTTVRNRCKGEVTDKDGRTWKYESSN